MRTPRYPPDGGDCPSCGARMWFVYGDPVSHIGAHQRCFRCDRRWKLVGEHGERVPFTVGEPTGQEYIGSGR